MTIDRAVMLFAGFVLLTGVALTYFVHPLWILLPTFVGVNMIQASITGFCPAAIVFRKLGIKPGVAFFP
ncbi:MAG TPA: DUF2892 domain-containing protein [Rhodospirillaceae bacterium]|nr:DUF2892 domain-containing protein [Rhodospirillaceae bacterium]